MRRLPFGSVVLYQPGRLSTVICLAGFPCRDDLYEGFLTKGYPSVVPKRM